MQEEQRAFKVFLSMHAHKATPTDEPVAHLQFVKDGKLPPSNCSLVRFSRDDVVEHFLTGKDLSDAETELVRFLLHQMTTYDCRTQRIVGLVFGPTRVLSDVLHMPRDEQSDLRGIE